MNRKILASLAGATVAVTTAVFGPAAPAHADDDIRNYRVDFTGGWGVRLRQAPSVNAPGFGADGKQALPEGALFPAECEDYGDEVTNVYGETTNLWMRAPGGVWVTTAYLDTGTNSRVGLPLCSEKDAGLRDSVATKTVADYHREGGDKVMVVNSDETKSRVYLSKAETRRAADALNSANQKSDFANSAFCIAETTLIGLLAGGADSGAKLVANTALGVGVDIGCEVLTGSLRPEGFEQAKGAATAAASAGKCYEVRMHRDSASDEWVADTWTVTDHQDYCA